MGTCPGAGLNPGGPPSLTPGEDLPMLRERERERESCILISDNI